MYEAAIVILGLYPPLVLFSARLTRLSLPAPSPMSVMGWVLLFGYTLKSFYLAYAANTDAPYRTKYLTNDIIHLGQIVVCVSVTFLVLGYLAKRQPPVAPGPARVRPRRQVFDPRVAYHGLFLAALMSMALYFHKMGLAGQVASLSFTGAKFFVAEATGQSSALGYLLVGGDVILVYLVYAYATGSRRQLFTVYLPATLFVMLCCFLTSKRFAVLIVLVAVALATNPRIFNRNVLKKLSRYLVALAVVVGISFASQIRTARDNVALGELDVGHALSTTVEHAARGAYFLDPAKLAAIVDRNPEFLLGSSFAMFLLAPVPRSLWPEKPAIRPGPYVAQEILDYGNRSGAPPTGPGELHMNFGWLGPTLGMALLGFCLACVESGYRRSADDPLARARYALLLMIFIFFMIGDFSYAMLFFIKYGIAALICERYWRWQAQRGSAGLRNPGFRRSARSAG